MLNLSTHSIKKFLWKNDAVSNKSFDVAQQATNHLMLLTKDVEDIPFPYPRFADE